MTKYQGHKSYAHWNVALWIGNDERLYREAVAARSPLKTKTRSLDEAAKFLLRRIEVIKGTRNPETGDGVPYTHETVREAIRYILK